MGDLMAGVGLGILGVIVFQISDMFTRYPAENEITVPWPYILMKAVSYFLLGFGAVLLVMGFL